MHSTCHRARAGWPPRPALPLRSKAAHNSSTLTLYTLLAYRLYFVSATVFLLGQASTDATVALSSPQCAP